MLPPESLLDEGSAVDGSVADPDSLGDVLGDSEGESVADPDSLGDSEGESDGEEDGESVGDPLSVGEPDGESVGEPVGEPDGESDGEEDGESVGEALSVGVGVGSQAGCRSEAAAEPTKGPTLRPITVVAAHAASAKRTCLRRSEDIDRDNEIPPRTSIDKAQCALVRHRSRSFLHNDGEIFGAYGQCLFWCFTKCR